MTNRPEKAADKFITRWQSASGSERANYQLFVHELCTLLELPTPDPAREDTRDNAYVFERRITFRHGDGTESPAKPIAVQLPTDSARNSRACKGGTNLGNRL